MPRKVVKAARRKKKAAAPRTTAATQRVAVSIAMLEQQAEQTSDRFDVLGEKFDRILSRVEELALHTTSLNSRHDTQIQVLQKQLASTETAIQQTREDISGMTNSITQHVGKEITEAMVEMSTAIDELSDKMASQYSQLDTRLQALERWRMLLIGGGIVAGAFLSNIVSVVSNLIKHI